MRIDLVRETVVPGYQLPDHTGTTAQAQRTPGR